VINLLDELKSRQGDRPELALRLWFGAFALLVVFAATVLNAALPLRLVDPRWLQGLIQVLLSQGFLPLIALVLLQLAVVIKPKSSRLRRRRDRFSRLALVAALGFALLIPLQLASTWGNLNQQTSGQNQQRLQGLAVIGQLRRAISTATSHQDLASPDPNQPERDPLAQRHGAKPGTKPLVSTSKLTAGESVRPCNRTRDLILACQTARPPAAVLSGR
jgi:hypothetical protein